MEKKENVIIKEKQEFKQITIGLVAEYHRMKNLLNIQLKMGAINQKEYYYFENYYILNLAKEK